MSVLSDTDRFIAILAARRRVTAAGCWEWTGYVHSKNGYGYYRTDAANLLAHRIAYEIYVGRIEAGMHLHHRCRNTICFNPAHLQALPHGEHTRLHHASALCPQCGGTNRVGYLRNGRPNGRTCLDCNARKKRERRAREKAIRNGCPYCGGTVAVGSLTCAAHTDLPALDSHTTAVVTATTNGIRRTTIPGSATDARQGAQ